MQIQLSKADKKAVRQIIDKGLKQDYINGISKVKAITDNWNKDNSDHREVYLKLYNVLTSHDKALSRKFDGLSGSRYIIAVINLLAEGLISEDDLDGLSDDLKLRLVGFVRSNL